MELSRTIAKNLHKIRKREGLSIGTLAEQTGISKAAISQIEQGRGNPTVNTITKLAAALHVGYAEILAATEEIEPKMLFADEIPMEIAPDGSSRRYTYYENTPQRDFDIRIIELEAGSKSDVEPTDGVVKYLVVNKGSVIVEIGEFSYFLMEGDAISFGAAESCVLKNEGTEAAQATCVRHFL